MKKINKSQKKEKKYSEVVSFSVTKGMSSFLAMQTNRCVFVREAVREKMAKYKHDEYVALRKEMGFDDE